MKNIEADQAKHTCDFKYCFFLNKKTPWQKRNQVLHKPQTERDHFSISMLRR